MVTSLHSHRGKFSYADSGPKAEKELIRQSLSHHICEL
jgi:hypothetical protein